MRSPFVKVTEAERRRENENVIFILSIGSKIRVNNSINTCSHLSCEFPSEVEEINARRINTILVDLSKCVRCKTQHWNTNG